MTEFTLVHAGRITLASALIAAAGCAAPSMPAAATENAGEAAAGSAGSAPEAMKQPVSPNDVESAALAATTCDGPAPVMKILDRVNGGVVSPDWSCLQPPVPPAAVGSAPMQALPFKLRSLTPELIAGVQVDFFLNASTLGAPHFSTVFDGSTDTVNIEVPSGQPSLTVLVHGLQREDMSRSIGELREYALPILKPSEPVQGFLLLTAQRRLIVNEVRRAPLMYDDDPAKAFLVSYARDCSGQDVSGARFELLDENGALVLSSADEGQPHTSYMQFAIPNPECTHTSFDQSAWVMINAPVNAGDAGVTKPYRLRVKGRLDETDSEPVVFGESSVEMVAGAVTFVHLAPAKF